MSVLVNQASVNSCPVPHFSTLTTMIQDSIILEIPYSHDDSETVYGLDILTLQLTAISKS